jgi:plasmid stability protein
MGSITLHNLDDSLYAMLKRKARGEGKSMNKTIQELLAEAMGQKRRPEKKGKARDEYAELCGAIPGEELKRMEDAEKEFEALDEREWK